MRSASSELIRQRYLAQYWDNLNAARDVVIVFDYSLQCDGQRATLNLISILDNTQARVGQQIRLWQVAIKYVQARQEWKIDSITYEELNHSNSKSYQANEIINNFLNIR